MLYIYVVCGGVKCSFLCVKCVHTQHHSGKKSLRVLSVSFEVVSLSKTVLCSLNPWKVATASQLGIDPFSQQIKFIGEGVPVWPVQFTVAGGLSLRASLQPQMPGLG